MLGDPSASRRRGAYGFTLTGLEDLPEGLLPTPANWPLLHLVQERSQPIPEPSAPGTMRIADDCAEVWVLRGDRIELDRATNTACLKTDAAVAPEALLHPYLALVAAIAGRWQGRWILHGGAFALQGHAWALLGGKGAGKSSTLAALLRAGHPPVSDDLLVLADTELFCGPRCVDLRRDAADRLGGRPIGLIGDRRRWRLRPTEVAPSLPLAGFVQLEWGEPARLEPLGAEERLQAVLGNAYFPPEPGEELALLELAGLPGWRFVRPQRIDQIEPATAQLLAGLG